MPRPFVKKIQACRAEFLNDEIQDSEDESENEESPIGDTISSQEEEEEEVEEEEDDSDYIGENDEQDENEPQIKSKNKENGVKNFNNEKETNKPVEGWNFATVAFRLSSSLRQLASKPENAVIGISPEAIGIFESEDFLSSNADKDSRSSNHLLGGVTLKGYRNEFPVSLQMNLEGIPNKRKHYTSDGNPGAFIFLKKDKARNIHVSLNEGTGNSNSPFLRNYPGWNLTNIADGINELDATTNSQLATLIRADHPIIGMFNKTKISQGEKALTVNDQSPMGYFTAKRDDATKCLNSLKQTMEKTLQIKNLYKTQIRFTRAFPNTINAKNSIIETIGQSANNWMDSEELFDNVSKVESEGKKLLLDKKYTLHLDITFKYKNLEKKMSQS